MSYARTGVGGSGGGSGDVSISNRGGMPASSRGPAPAPQQVCSSLCHTLSPRDLVRPSPTNLAIALGRTMIKLSLHRSCGNSIMVSPRTQKKQHTHKRRPPASLRSITHAAGFFNSSLSVCRSFLLFLRRNHSPTPGGRPPPGRVCGGSGCRPAVEVGGGLQEPRAVRPSQARDRKYHIRNWVSCGVGTHTLLMASPIYLFLRMYAPRRKWGDAARFCVSRLVLLSIMRNARVP